MSTLINMGAKMFIFKTHGLNAHIHQNLRIKKISFPFKSNIVD